MTDDAGAQALASAYAAIQSRIDAACARADRDPRSVTLLAVSKTVAADRLRDAVRIGIRTFGENRVQEAAAKAPDVPGSTWQLIGPLQSNKARRAIEIFDLIHSVDSVGLAARLDRLARDVRQAGPEARYPILLQVNVDGDPAKAGLAPSDLPDAIAAVERLDALELRGLMTIGQLVGDAEAARATFRKLRDLSDQERSGSALGPELSMGMSDDFEVAIEEGATIVRIGRTLFGERPAADPDGTGRTQG
jgi:PLP dependent protein